MLALADQALHTAQRKGPNQYEVMTRPEQSGIQLGAHEWRERLRDYLSQNRLIVHFQPVVNIANHELLHYELLLRARESAGALIPAGIFIPLAERTGLAQAIHHRAIELAVNSPALQRPQPGTVTVNLSSGSINDPGFIDWLTRLRLCAAMFRAPPGFA